MTHTAEHAPTALGTDDALERLLGLRRDLLAEAARAPSPAVHRALEMADAYLFLALSYLGHTDELYPDEHAWRR